MAKETPMSGRKVKTFAGLADSRPRLSDADDMRKKGRA